MKKFLMVNKSVLVFVIVGKFLFRPNKFIYCFLIY